jgi:hypothetical protein
VYYLLVVDSVTPQWIRQPQPRDEKDKAEQAFQEHLPVSGKCKESKSDRKS